MAFLACKSSMVDGLYGLRLHSEFAHRTNMGIMGRELKRGGNKEATTMQTESGSHPMLSERVIISSFCDKRQVSMARDSKGHQL
jgi:hypothetical protein